MIPNINKRNPEIEALLKHSHLSKKITIYFSSKTVGPDFDSYEQNYTYTNLNPLIVRGFVRDIKAEALVWKQYGLSEAGAKEVVIPKKYAEYFRLANKIEIDKDSYQVYKENVGNRVLIEDRPFELCRVILQKMK